MDLERLNRQLDFLAEIDKAKQVLRNTVLMDASRRENDAEHSWHMALGALVLAEHADDSSLDLAKVVKMALLHDLVEIDAGDTFAYGNYDAQEKARKENAAAVRIFGLLPSGQGSDFLALWREFEDGETSESRYAQAMDCFMPLLHNYRTRGLQWQRMNVTRDQVLARHRRIEKASRSLWDYVQTLVGDAVAKGYLRA